MEIYKPIFIVGAPRSGTTLLYDLMAFHKDLAWFSQVDLKEMLSDDFLNFVNIRRRLFEIRRWQFSRDGFEGRVTTSYETPNEVGLFWNRWIRGSWMGSKDGNSSDKQELRKAVSSLLIKKGKKRFLSKNPAHSIRIEYLNEVFPGAIFVNIIRDVIPVVASMTRGSRRFNNPNGYFGLPLKLNNQMEFDLLERHVRQWKEVNDEIQRAKNNLEKSQYTEIKYENIISNPKFSLSKIFKFCQLEAFDIFDKGFKRITDDIGEVELISEKLTSRNTKYKDEFTESQINKINKVVEN